MEVEQFTSKGIGRMNEDVLLVAEPVFGVFDGVTSLDEYSDPDGKTGGLLAASLARDAFAERSDNLTSAALRASADIEQAMRGRHIDTTKGTSRWGTAAAVVRIGPATIAWIRIADCSVLFLHANGEITALVDDAQIHRDALRLCVPYARRRTPHYFELLVPKLRENRNRANRDYGVLNGDPRVEEFIASGTVPRADVRAILLHTDGFATPKADPDAPDDYAGIMRSVLQSGLAVTAQEIRRQQEADPECWAYPRFKKSDDIAAMLIKLTP